MPYYKINHILEGRIMGEVKSIFNFLKDYNGLLNPVVTEIDRQLWNYKILNAPQIEELWSIYHTQNLDQLKILEIKRPDLKPCPPPDKIILEWIEGEWQSLDTISIYHKEKIIRKTKDENGEIVEIGEYFIEDKNRISSLKNWLQKRENWRMEELPKREGLNLYNNLFELYSRIKRESESVELILGDGHIKWLAEGRLIDHPVLLQKVNLEFNSNKPSFIIRCEELKTELYTPMLRVIPSINQSMLPDIIQEAENIYHIADRENNIGVFKRLINVVEQSGKYVDDLNGIHEGPIITYDPILFLRKRTLGYSIFIDNIIEDIELNEDKVSPTFFETMVGNYSEHNGNGDMEEEWNYSGIDQDVLLTLPANNEQLKIMKYLDDYGAVLVQGPPGTGKTHTIANLIGHLLSEGKTVLVTSQTEKALTVLKDKVDKDLQGLCMSLLSTSSQQKEMDAVLFEIDEKSTAIDLNDSLKRIHRLEEERKDLIERYKNKNQELLYIRGLDYKDIVFANETITPIEAAKFINQGKERYSYIPGKSKDDTSSMPLSYKELDELYKSNELITNIEEEFLAHSLPDLKDIWTIDEFNKKSEEYLKYRKLTNDWTPKLKLIPNIDKEIILELIEDAKNIKEDFNKLEDFQYDILTKSINDSVYNEFWEQIFENYDILKVEYDNYRRILFENDYYIPKELVVEETIFTLEEIIETKKEIPVNWISRIAKPKWKKLSNSITNNSKPIEKLENYQHVNLLISYEIKRSKLVSKIDKLIGGYSKLIDLKNGDIERNLDTLINRVKVSLNWYEDNWVSYTSKVQKYIMELDKYNELCAVDFNQTIESMNYVLNELFIKEFQQEYHFTLLEEIIDEFNIYKKFLNQYKVLGGPFDELLRSTKEKSTSKYKCSYKEIIGIYNKKELYSRRIELLERLQKIAPDWENAIKNRDGIHGNSVVPNDIELAWKWNQLNNQVNRINSYEPNVIQREIDKINELLMENARELAYEKAWYYQVKNITVEETQAIKGWRQTMKQVGKGTGKNAPRLLKKARELMPSCQTAIPVWIMPLNRVAENFDPQKNRFDVVIIDEASQADLLALSALYLGEKIIIVGDDEQVSPNPVGIKTHEINALIEQHLQDVPLNHLYNGQTSIYDMAQNSGFKPLMLTEHFRCLPEIIKFSNNLSYNGKIRALRDATGVNVKPAVVPYRVSGGYKLPNKTNPVEAEHIVSLICACIENEEYDGKTIGVISLLGQEKDQANEIDKLLRLKLDPREYVNRRIQCGTPAQFQGDERDIIFLSIVEGPSEDGGPVWLVSESGRNDMYRKRYNVAASRARDQMWVVYSLNPETDLKPEDIRLRLIKHAINPSSTEEEIQLNHTESDFEIEVMKILLNRGYKVHPQWKVGSYRIDMVVEDGDKRVAIECDGERWHPPEKLAEDMKRQAILERLGWRFIRIRGSQFYKESEQTMERVINELDSYDIKPNYLNQDGNIHENESEENELLKKVKRRAEEIRLEWKIDSGYIEPNDVDEKIIEENIALQEEAKIDDSKFEQVEEVQDDEILKNEEKVQKEIKDETVSEEKKEEWEREKERIKGEGQDKLSDKPTFDFRKGKATEEISDDANNYLRTSEKGKGDNTRTKPLFDFRNR